MVQSNGLYGYKPRCLRSLWKWERIGEGPTVTAILDYSHSRREAKLKVNVEGGKEEEMRADQGLQLAITEAKDPAERRCRRDGVTDEIKVKITYLEAETSTDTVERDQEHLDRDTEAESDASDLNAETQGLGDRSVRVKAKEVRKIVRKTRLPVIYLKETKILESRMRGDGLSLTEFGLGGPFQLWALTVGTKGGVAIILTRFFMGKVLDFFWDTLGDWAWVFIEEGGRKLLVATIYAPVDVTERKWFRRNFTACLLETDAMLLIGDFNTVIRPGRDSVVSGDPKPDADALCALMTDMALVDAFRRIFPDDRSFTWFGTSPLLRSRLDMAWISPDLLPNLQGFDQQLVPISDHKLIVTSLALHPRVLRRPPPMSIPTWLLSDALNSELVQQHWEYRLRLRPHHMSFLEHLQHGIRASAANMKRRAKASRHAHDQTGQEYVCRMEALGEIPPAGGEDEWWAEWVLLHSEWASWQARDAELWGLSSKTKSVRDAERMSKAFFARMKRTSHSSLIVAMGHPFDPLEGKAENTADILRYVELFYENLYREDECWPQEDMAAVPTKDVWDKCAIRVTLEHRASLDVPITHEEVARALSGMHRGKAPGPDGLSAEYLMIAKSCLSCQARSRT
ncbi:hypothetical protein CBR_g11953 [Chara braunii]|uniref:Endonuclease/exonuclease/phosphatase domain-containing protein n=1 Tax=Chara braunii TaxID=69332 RepID=A0A388KQP4_CHABU|nr:hypothetical protein CBR_g11953 [Chara braunii]|eukprot:GBG72375.1 hypothetical protein CBR_g11953 [Chara braunii]